VDSGDSPRTRSAQPWKTRGKLKPQMFATFSIITSGESDALAVPEEAVVREGEAARVWVVQGANDLHSDRFTPGRINNGMV